MNETDLAWLAGFIDADGHIGLGSRGKSAGWFRPILQIGQADPTILMEIIEMVGSGKLSSNGKRQPEFYNLRYGSTVLRWLLPKLIPHLRVKRRRAEVLLRYLEDCRYAGKKLTEKEISQREDFKEELRILNLKPAARKRANGGE